MKIAASQRLLLLVFLCLNFSSGVFLQTVTLGSGTDINSITTSSPINIWYRKTVCQMVYTASELTAAGAVAGPITQMGFFVTNNPIYDLPGYEIQMKHTTAPDASGSLEGGYTTVLSMDTYSPASGSWDMLNLDIPFVWDGTQNIVVRICWSQVSPSFDPSGQLRVYSSTNGYKYRRSDAAGTACGMVPNITLNTKPQIRFIMLAETQWSGTVSNDWFNPANWTAGVPSPTMDASIAAGTPFSPYLNSAGSCKNLNLAGALTLGVNAQLDIYDDFMNTGTYNDLGGITQFTGVFAHTLTTSLPITIMNLHLTSSAGLTLTGDVIVGNELQVNKGLLNTGGNLTMRSDITGTARIDELSTTCTYTLSMTDSWGDGWNGGFLTVYEDGAEIGTFSAVGAASSATFQIVSGASFTLNYTSGSYEGENAYTLTDEGGTVLFSDGPSPATGDVYSDVASGCSFSSTITGNITMERYIDEGETFWRYFASAVENPTISQYMDDFTTAGFPGSPFPDFPFTSVYSYDETLGPGLGYVPCAGADEVIEVGQGYQVWSGDTITGTEAFLVDLTGPANQGDINLPVTYTPSGTPSEDGWCLIGNPYASSINWDDPDWTKTNMANATYIQNPDNQIYATYIAGAGANGGSRFIASQQSFWVQATGASPVLTIREGVKTPVDAVFFKSGETYSPGMTIQLNKDDLTDEAVLRHIAGALDEVEPQFDAVKLWGGWGSHPQVTLLNNEAKDLTVHSIDKEMEEWAIPVRVVVFESGVYELKFLNTEELDVPCLKLEDTYTGTMYDIATDEETSLSFELFDTTYAPRFVLHFGREYDYFTINASCYGGASGEVELDLAIEEELAYELIADDGTTYGTSTGNPLVIDGLHQGLYLLNIDGLDDLCETSFFHFTIDEPTPITVEATVTDEIIGGDGTISLATEGGIYPYMYDWSNGAIGNSIDELVAGVYEVLITDGNGCEYSETYEIESVSTLGVNNNIQETLKFKYDTFNKQITIAGLDDEVDLYLYAMNGELVEVYTVSGGSTVIQLGANLAKGVYMLRPLNWDWNYRFAY